MVLSWLGSAPFTRERPSFTVMEPKGCCFSEMGKIYRSWVAFSCISPFYEIRE